MTLLRSSTLLLRDLIFQGFRAMTRTESQENTTARAGPSPARPGEAEPIPSCRQPRIGSDFLGFHLLEILGRGAFGTVYLARQGDLADRLVVLKISARRDEEPRLLAQLQHTNIVPIYSIHSARSLQAVCMPFFGTTTLQDVGEHLKSQVMLPETGLGLISSLIDNRLEQQTRLTTRSEHGGDPPSGEPGQNDIPGESERPQPPLSDETLKYLKGLTYVQAVLWIGSRLASGLAHAHERKILHLDLKPANILLT